VRERIYNLQPHVGLIVPVTIGPSNAEQERRFEAGIALIEKPTYALISPMDEVTLISDRLQAELKLPVLGLKDQYIPALPRGLRQRFIVVISIDGFARRSVDAYAIIMPSPVDCIIGRDILSLGSFSYDGPDGTFRLALPE
jgi:hypothetical protein